MKPYRGKPIGDRRKGAYCVWHADGSAWFLTARGRRMTEWCVASSLGCANAVIHTRVPKAIIWRKT